mmetsp:Transcript_2636/g.4807  ORF Transcript_2636/g.4807 Transcript_2636/m.4807 type:complete len:202 (+) Transcript_2636:746-1351(+)
MDHVKGSIRTHAFVDSVHLVKLHHGVLFRVINLGLKRQDLVVKKSISSGLSSATVALNREVGKVLLRQVILLGHHFCTKELTELHLVLVRQMITHVEAKPVLAGQAYGGQKHRDAGHGLHTSSNDNILRARHDSLRGEVYGLLRRPTLSVNGSAGDRLGQLGRKDTVAGHVGCLLTGLTDTTHEYVIHKRWVHSHAIDKGI